VTGVAPCPGWLRVASGALGVASLLFVTRIGGPDAGLWQRLWVTVNSGWLVLVAVFVVARAAPAPEWSVGRSAASLRVQLVDRDVGHEATDPAMTATGLADSKQSQPKRNPHTHVADASTTSRALETVTRSRSTPDNSRRLSRGKPASWMRRAPRRLSRSSHSAMTSSARKPR